MDMASVSAFLIMVNDRVAPTYLFQVHHGHFRILGQKGCCHLQKKLANSPQTYLGPGSKCDNHSKVPFQMINHCTARQQTENGLFYASTCECYLPLPPLYPILIWIVANSCTSWQMGKNPLSSQSLPTGAGFLPSTVLLLDVII